MIEMDPEGIEPSTSCMPSKRYTANPWALSVFFLFFLLSIRKIPVLKHT